MVHSTGLYSTIQIKQLLQKVGMFNWDLVRLIRPKNRVEQNMSRTKSGLQISFTNV